jgi:hypothetical protein
VDFDYYEEERGWVSEYSVTRENRTNTGTRTYVASQVIENNSAGGANSYLSCVGGAPYDGIRCKLNGWAGKPGPIALTATKQ